MTAQMNEARVVPGLEEYTNTDAQSIADKRKRFETLRARLALRGYELRPQADGTLLIVYWDLAKTLSDLDAAERFAQQVGAA